MSTEYLIEVAQRYADLYQPYDRYYYQLYSQMVQKLKNPSFRTTHAGTSTTLDKLKKMTPEEIEDNLADVAREQLGMIVDYILGLNENSVTQYIDNHNIISIDQIWDSLTRNQKLAYYYFWQVMNGFADGEFAIDKQIVMEWMNQNGLTGSIGSSFVSNHLVYSMNIHIDGDDSQLPSIVSLFEQTGWVIATISNDKYQWRGIVRFQPYNNAHNLTIDMKTVRH
jgi:hypothetical protein